MVSKEITRYEEHTLSVGVLYFFAGWGSLGRIAAVSSWLGKSPTCRRHVCPTAKSRHFWPTRPRRADTNSFPTLFFVSGFADFLQIFSKYQRYMRSNHRTNWYVYIKQSVQPGYFFACLTYYSLNTMLRNC